MDPLGKNTYKVILDSYTMTEITDVNAKPCPNIGAPVVTNPASNYPEFFAFDDSTGELTIDVSRNVPAGQYRLTYEVIIDYEGGWPSSLQIPIIIE